jgi:hypothetical protein
MGVSFIRERARELGVLPLSDESDAALRHRLLACLGRMSRLGTTADFADIADEALRRETPMVIDLASARRFVVFAWVRELAGRSLWRRVLGRLVVWGFFKLARGTR